VKTLLILRHAKSDWGDPGLDDHDRPLNKRGKRDALRVGRLLREEDLVPDLVLTSTATRAARTARRVARAAAFAGKTRPTSALYLAGPRAYLKVLRALPDSYGRVLVVGHNPGLEELVAHLTGEPVAMPTAALARVTLPLERWHDLTDVTRGTLEQVWRPREL
jgi:phosphohistidine phosphatase